jgi:integrase
MAHFARSVAVSGGRPNSSNNQNVGTGSALYLRAQGDGDGEQAPERPQRGIDLPAKDGRFVGAVSLGMVDGKRRRKVIYGDTREEVRQKLVKIHNDLRRGLPVQTSGTSVASFLEEWLISVAGKVAPKTLKNYTMVVRVHLVPALGSHKLEKLTQRHVQAMLDSRSANGLSPRSVVYIRNILRAALNEAMRQDLVQRNVATLVHPPRISTYEAHNLTPEEANRLLAAVRGDRLEALYLVSLILGLRQGEALGLRWEDVNLDVGTMTIRRQLQVIDGQPTFTEPKTQRSRRTIPLPATVTDMLARHRIRQKEDRLAAGGRWQAQWGVVFADEVGAPISHTCAGMISGTHVIIPGRSWCASHGRTSDPGARLTGHDAGRLYPCQCRCDPAGHRSPR